MTWHMDVGEEELDCGGMQLQVTESFFRMATSITSNPASLIAPTTRRRMSGSSSTTTTFFDSVVDG